MNCSFKSLYNTLTHLLPPNKNKTNNKKNNNNNKTSKYNQSKTDRTTLCMPLDIKIGDEKMLYDIHRK